ncbi:MAG: NPCBM/NEW2 domain-containing protein [Firmicutes bacterium]|nr:NPCBM/NEW2 domain-containing protein [Bacillota bacterium]MCM1401317.1 NPCBM/NEW2 domain-containing protein [Bacteroides sp.]MCM1477270.1 NPCBM/NEW2 domain-containing protein [Bacteroides sp.]
MNLKQSISMALALIFTAGAEVEAASYTSVVEPTTGTGIVQMSELDLTPVTFFEDEGKTGVRANYTTATQSNNPIVLKGIWYKSGVGTHAPSKAVVKINGATSFHSVLGVDDDADLNADHGIVDYTVKLYKDKTATTIASGTLTRASGSEGVKVIDLDLTGYDYLMLDYSDGDHPWADHCVWADARFNYSGEQPEIIAEEDMYKEGGGTVEPEPEPTDPNMVYLPKVGENGEEIIPLSSLDITKITNGWGTIQANKSIDGNTLTLKGKKYESGVGAHATAQVIVKLNGAVTKFHCVLGIDDEVIPDCRYNSTYGVCNYSVKLVRQDGTENVVKSGTIRQNQEPATIDIDGLEDYKYLVIDLPEGTGGNSCDHSDIANAYFYYVEQNSTRPMIVTSDGMDAQLNCATIMFSQPGVKYMHKLRSNNPDATITVSGLPTGLEWNDARKLVEGVIDIEGEYGYTAHIAVDGDVTDVPVTLTVSSNLQQPVPFMGWLSWNVVQDQISENVIKTVADAMVSQGLRDAGYNYLVIDDLWHASARETGTRKPLPSPTKFPNGMKVCADYVHDKGLKFGIYSDAGNYTCAKAFGSYGFEEIDAKQYADWGVDLLKYDYCDAPDDLATCRARYKTMGEALKNSGRDILFYMCEWGVREPWKWAPETGATCWRATYDTRDGWVGVSNGIGMQQSVALMKDLWPYNGVNRFNDADMMCVGIHGTGKSSNDLVQKAGMTMTEYRSQFSMWCMWSSPLTLSFDLRKSITDEDLALMTNPELIAINQDRMGQAAEFVSADANQMHLFFKDLENGDVAVAVINMSSAAHPFTVNFSDIEALSANTEYAVRDLVNREDLEPATDKIEFPSIASHETRVVRLSKKSTNGIDTIEAGKALSDMTVTDNGDSLNVCVPGTEGVAKRILVSDVEGRVLASASGSEECFTINRPHSKVVVVNAICAGHTQNVKCALH